MGSNSLSQLGQQNIEFITKPIKINIPDKIKSIACGDDFSVFVTELGEVYTCGNNKTGQSGFHKKLFSIIKTPKKIEGLSDIQFARCGVNYTILLDNQGKIQVFGLMPGVFYYSKGPKQASFYKPKLLEEYKSEISNFEKEYNNKIYKIELGKIINIACGRNHILLLTEKNQVFACGSNLYGELGLGVGPTVPLPDYFPLYIEDLKNIVKISAGNTISFCVSADGLVYTFGKLSHSFVLIPNFKLKTIQQGGNYYKKKYLQYKRKYLQIKYKK